MAALVPSAVTVAVSLFVITADRSGIHMHWISKMKFMPTSILATEVVKEAPIYDGRTEGGGEWVGKNEDESTEC